MADEQRFARVELGQQRGQDVVGLLVDIVMEARILDNLALARLRGGDAPGAREALARVRQVDPRNARLPYIEALALRAEGRIQEAGWRMEESMERPAAGLSYVAGGPA